MAVRYRFRRFGEGDDFDDVDAEDLLGRLVDDLLEDGDLEGALDRLLREGFETEAGEHVEGLTELLDRSRRRRRELEAQADPSGELERYREWLEHV
ncbi:MAG TPA: hypothetical protein PLS29_08600, partial [Acidimicrobiales bacterium]|nr:hypothetical protein [Acidimicrobiales bacterium]